MPLLLNIESATGVCSVALSENGRLLSIRESSEPKIHGTAITVFVEQVMKDANKKLSDLDAIAVSKGPGSYTGLRIGVSTAKGLCYALDKPLISIPTLQAMTRGAVKTHSVSGSHLPPLYCPMIDARRMEVYCAVYDENLLEIKPTAAEILTEHSFGDLLLKYKIYFFGDGSSKFKSFLSGNSNAVYLEDNFVSARHMITVATKKFSEKLFENLARFEPYYLKDFLTTTPKKLL